MLGKLGHGDDDVKQMLGIAREAATQRQRCCSLSGLTMM
jgi:hypothetical protein